MLVWIFIVLLAAAAVGLRKLTPAAGVAGAAVAACLYVGLGSPGIAMLGAFFILGTAASSWRGSWKEQEGLHEGNSGRRRVAQVLANGGAAAAAGLVAAALRWYEAAECMPDENLVHRMQVAAAAALSAATADTLASELGNVYGRRYIDLRSGRPGRRGDDGVVSLEGTLFGFAGSLVIAALFYLALHPRLWWALVILTAGTFGNLFDSLLGATLQRRGRLSNDGVNFLNTLGAAVVALALVLWR